MHFMYLGYGVLYYSHLKHVFELESIGMYLELIIIILSKYYFVFCRYTVVYTNFTVIS